MAKRKKGSKAQKKLRRVNSAKRGLSSLMSVWAWAVASVCFLVADFATLRALRHDRSCKLVPNKQPQAYISAGPPFGNEPPKAHRKLSKAELREQAEAAFLAWRAGQSAKDK
jgi:hypothetical protein